MRTKSLIPKICDTKVLLSTSIRSPCFAHTRAGEISDVDVSRDLDLLLPNIQAMCFLDVAHPLEASSASRIFPKECKSVRLMPSPAVNPNPGRITITMEMKLTKQSRLRILYNHSTLSHIPPLSSESTANLFQSQLRRPWTSSVAYLAPRAPTPRSQNQRSCLHQSLKTQKALPNRASVPKSRNQSRNRLHRVPQTEKPLLHHQSHQISQKPHHRQLQSLPSTTTRPAISSPQPKSLSRVSSTSTSRNLTASGAN